MCNNKEIRTCENCEFSQFGIEYKKGIFEGMCQNKNIPPKGPYPEFPHIRRVGTCGFWQLKKEDQCH